MSDGGNKRQDIPTELQDGDNWFVAKLTDSSGYEYVSIESKSDIVIPPPRHSLDEAVSYIHSTEEDLLLFCNCPKNVVVITWHCTDHEHHQDPHVAKALSQLQSFTERVAGGPTLQTFVTAPVDYGRLETEDVSILTSGPRMPVWTPISSDAQIEYLPHSIRELTERELYDVLEPFLPWGHAVSEPDPPNPDSWKLSAIQDAEKWATVDPRHDLDDREILERAMNAGRPGEYFMDLMENDTADLDMGRSMAKQALMNLLAYWFCFDIGKMKHYFGKSKLAGRTTVYGNGTVSVERYVARALVFVDDCYPHEYRDDEVVPLRETWHPNAMPVSFPGES